MSTIKNKEANWLEKRDTKYVIVNNRKGVLAVFDNVTEATQILKAFKKSLIMAHKKTRKNPKGAGRPKGSKNKPAGLRLAQLAKGKRGPGRPKKHHHHTEKTVHAIHNGKHVVITGTMKYV